MGINFLLKVGSHVFAKTKIMLNWKVNLLNL